MEERLAQDMALERAHQGANDRPTRQDSTAIEFRQIKAALPSMQMGNDILTFFMSFECCHELNGVDSNLWARLLPAQLSQKALKIFARLSLEDTRCYETVKRAILARFKLNAELFENFQTNTSNRSDDLQSVLNTIEGCGKPLLRCQRY